MRKRARSLLLVGLSCFACGPSLNTVHEGAVRFEHCYGVDLNPKAEAAQRKACWQLWVSSYTVGQPRDRIEYAQRRLHALDGDDDQCPKLALDREHPPEARQFYLVVPTPTSVHRAPPPVATVVQAVDAGVPPEGNAAKTEAGHPSGGAKTSEGNKEPPAESCATGCRGAWESCDGACAARSTKGVCADCKTTYTRCMRSCFQ